jgi:dihydroorotase
VLSLGRLIDVMSTAPSRLFHLGRGTLAIGAPADIVCFDAAAEFTVDPKSFHSKGKNSPFGGQRVRGAVAATICNGQFTYQRGEGETFAGATP